MKVIRKESKTVRLDSLYIGEVFCLPYDTETIYMVIDRYDIFINQDKFDQDSVAFVDIEEGGIYAAHGDKEVIKLHGSFVLDN